jgi:hypothetical protein
VLRPECAQFVEELSNIDALMVETVEQSVLA